MENKLKIVFAGSPKSSSTILQSLIDNSKVEVPYVISQEPKRAKRGNKLIPTEVAIKATENGIDLLEPTSLNEIKKLITGFDFDFLLVAAYGKILPNWMLNAPVYEPINVHYSVLPKHRGASPIQSTILTGDTMAGISIMKMTKGLDEGPIYRKFKIDINESDKEELEEKLSVIAAKNITSVLSEIKNKNIKPIAQNEDDASYCNKIKKESGLIDLQKDDSEKILLKFRAYKGWPGVFFRYKNVDIKIHGLKLLDPNDDIHMENSGSIFKVTKDGLYIKTIDSKIVITHLQMPGKKVINKSDIYNAYSNYFE